jgi:UbiD family decarboxylase
MKRQLAYDSLRDWIEHIDALGELRRIDGASWQSEIGAITDIFQHDEKAPAVLFDNVPGYPRGFRILCNAFGGKRQNVTLGFPTSLSKVEMSEAFLHEYREAKGNPIPFEWTETGPVLENVLTGNEVDVLKFPVPKWHEGDGGRYIGTGCFNVTMDPDEKWINVGTYRVMVHDERSVGFYISPGKHGRIHRDKYMERGEPMPVCVVVGMDPLTFLMAANALPYGTCEYDITGGYRGHPLKVVKGRYTGLPFPADAEIVLEGFVRPGNVRHEGPFGEWTGFYGSPVDDAPVLDVKAVYHRNDPIILGCPPQRPPGESSRARAILRSALIREEMQKAGIPGVTAVWAHEVGSARMLIAVAIKQAYPGHSRQAGHVASQCGAGAYAGKYVVVVDDDIDVSDLTDLIWGMLFRSNPETSIDIIRNAWSTPLDPAIPPEQKRVRDYTNSRAIIDACRPYHWRDQYPKVNMPSRELIQQVREKFGALVD